MEGSLWRIIFNGDPIPGPKQIATNFLTGLGMMSGGIAAAGAVNSYSEQQEKKKLKQEGKVLSQNKPSALEQRRAEVQEDIKAPATQYRSEITRRNVQNYENNLRSRRIHRSNFIAPKTENFINNPNIGSRTGLPRRPIRAVPNHIKNDAQPPEL
jgi:hypothetical protein